MTGDTADAPATSHVQFPTGLLDDGAATRKYDGSLVRRTKHVAITTIEAIDFVARSVRPFPRLARRVTKPSSL
jgi:hypothetical protein